MSVTVLDFTEKSFPKRNRLNTAEEYSNVFSRAKKSSDVLLTVLVKKNNEALARLGLAIAKKNVKKAVQRNKIKRIVRESFRLNKHRLEGFDIVVLCRQKAALASKKELAMSIQMHWEKLLVNE